MPAAVRNSSVVAASSATATSASIAALDLASPAIPANDSEKARQTEAAELARRLVALVVLPAGAARVTAPPAPQLTAAPETEMTSRMATATSYFTVPGDINSVLTYVQVHAPSGLVSSGGGSGGGQDDYSASVNLMGTQTFAFEAPELLISAAQDGAVIGVRVDAHVVWLPMRTTAELVPATVGSATLQKVSEDASPSAPLALGGPEARHLATILNALPTASDGERHCPPAAWQAMLTFATSPAIAVGIDFCGIRVSVNDVSQPALADDSGTLINAIEQLLGLPVDSARPAAPMPAASLIQFPCPPPGWSPLTATADELQKYGYPLRPDAAHDQGWVDAMKAAGPPHTCPAN